jgi:HlyD family secretion protein
MVKTKLELTNQDSDLVEFKMADQQKLQDYKLNLAEAFQSLLSDISKWEKQYLLISPINGRLTYSKYWSEHQFVKADEEVVTVVPDNNQPIIAKVKMPLENSGKVKTGQKILIKLVSYPYQEYGQIESRVDAISLVP